MHLWINNHQKQEAALHCVPAASPKLSTIITSSSSANPGHACSKRLKVGLHIWRSVSGRLIFDAVARFLRI